MRDAALVDRQLLSLLRRTSRSFYLSVRFLPRRIRLTIALAYLLARATDTIADANGVEPELRLELLGAISESFKRELTRLEPVPLAAVAKESIGAERELLEQLPRVFRRFLSLPARHRRLVAEVVRTIVRGQSLDLERFELQSGLQSLRNDQELAEYTYLVAGSVGRFWTELCLLEWANYSTIADEEIVSLGIGFGQGLQLINILRDLPADLQNGRCYLPVADPVEVAANPAVADGEFRRWRRRATELMNEGWTYVRSIRPVRVRFACALPILIGLRTLGLLQSVEAVRPGLKVARPEVYRLICLAGLAAAVPLLGNAIFQRELLPLVCRDEA
jgi:farnesyl-diphosphate farnesyltransferase